MKITSKEYTYFVDDYMNGMFFGKSVGKAFTDKYNLIDPKLYHEKDEEKAWDRIAEKYVDFPTDEFIVDEY